MKKYLLAVLFTCIFSVAHAESPYQGYCNALGIMGRALSIGLQKGYIVADKGNLSAGRNVFLDKNSDTDLLLQSLQKSQNSKNTEDAERAYKEVFQQCMQRYKS